MPVLHIRTPTVRTFLGIMDLKLGISLITVFALLNKVAGCYGIIAVFVGGSASQVALYLYSMVSAGLFLWCLKGVAEENGIVVSRYTIIFFLDHLLNTLFTIHFAVAWYLYTPHDGQRVAKSAAQEAIRQGAGAPTAHQGAGNPAIGGQGTGGGGPDAERMGELNDAQRISMARDIWTHEKGFGLIVLAVIWILKIYFTLCIHSFATQLQKGSYKPLAQVNNERRARKNTLDHAPGQGSPDSLSWRDSNDRLESGAANASEVGSGIPDSVKS